MKQSGLPAVFEEIVREPMNAVVRKALSKGDRAIGYTCSYVPIPLLSVRGLLPLRIRAPGARDTPAADTYLSTVLCTYTRSVLQFALDERLDFLDGWVFAASCDHMRRLHDNLQYLRRPAFAFILDVPHKTGEEALSWYEQELRRLGDELGDRFGVDTGDDALTESIARHNVRLALLRSLGELRKRPDPPLSGTDFLTLLVAAVSAPAPVIIDALKDCSRRIQGQEGIRDRRARLMVVGSHLDEPGYIRAIESQGGLVVADRFCIGSLPGLEEVPSEGDPYRTLAGHYLRSTRCPRMMDDFDLRLKDILQSVQDFDVEGVVVVNLKFCDLWGVEGGPLVDALKDAGLPVLRLEREYTSQDSGQLKTRLQAFFESMGR